MAGCSLGVLNAERLRKTVETIATSGVPSMQPAKPRGFDLGRVLGYLLSRSCQHLAAVHAVGV